MASNEEAREGGIVVKSKSQLGQLIGPPFLHLGRLVLSTNAVAKITPIDVLDGLARHDRGERGDFDLAELTKNQQELAQGRLLCSAHYSGMGTRFWIVTDWERSMTTVFLPTEY